MKRLPLPRIDRVARERERRIDDGHILLAAALIFMIGLILAAPEFRAPSEFTGRREIARETGFKATIDRLTALNLLAIERLPAQTGLPARDRVMLNSPKFAAAATAVGANGLGKCRVPPPPLKERARRFGEQALALFRSDRAPAPDPCLELFRQYRTSTFLGTDMLRADRDLWKIENERIVGIRDNAHALRESGYASGPADAALKFATLTEMQFALSPQLLWTLVDPASGTGSPVAGRDGRVCGGLPFGPGWTAHCLEGGMLVGIPAGTRLRANGRRLAAAPTAGLLFLRSGDTIGIEAGGRTRSWQLLRQPDMLSVVAPDGQRIRHPAFASLAMQIPDSGLRNSLRTTVRADLQKIVQDSLEARLEPLAKGLNAQLAADQTGRGLRGAVLLMDGMTGAIATAATFPSKPEHLSPAERTDPARLRRLRLNQNFEMLAVGSTAKVPFAAAIAKADPGIVDPGSERQLKQAYAGQVCVDWKNFARTGKSRSCAGASEIERVEPSSNGGAPFVTFERFIAHSNNFYAISLLQRGWERSRTDSAPKTWLHDLRAFTCADSPRVAGSNDAACPVYPWGSPSDRLRGTTLDGLRLAFPRDFVPTKSNFFDSVTGGGDFRWTTPQLAQAYSRILTGRGIAPRLIADAKPPAMKPAFGLPPKVWSAVADGMQGVITYGTAHWPERDRQFGSAIHLYGKTGTPRLPDRKNNGKVFVLALARTPSGAAPRSAADICALKVIVVNFEYQTPQVGFVSDLLKNPAVREWATQSCGRRS